MRLLICTQAIDADDPILGFFVRWVEELAKRSQHVTVLCLRAGRHGLPSHVRVIELNGSRVTRIIKILRYIVVFRHHYDRVFVHMSQEFVLLGGVAWRVLGKKVFLWRNHYAGGILTRLSGALCDKVFYTSHYSYTAHFKNAVHMPVGIDTDVFIPRSGRERGSVLFLGRIAPSKRPELLIEAARSLPCSIDFYGPGQRRYIEELSKKAEGMSVAFRGSVSNAQAPAVFAAHEIFVNMSPAGMFDKTIIEAASAGCLIATSSPDAAKALGITAVPTAGALKGELVRLLGLSAQEAQQLSHQMREKARAHSLGALMERLVAQMS